MPSVPPPVGLMMAPDGLDQLLVRSLAATQTSVVITDALLPDHPVIWVNDAFQAVSGYPSGEMLGRNARMLQGPETDPGAVAELGLALREQRSARTRLLNYRPDGRTWWNEMHIGPVRNQAGEVTHFVGFQHDVSADVAAEQRTEHAASHDGLTGLANRTAFLAQVEHELARAARDGRSLAVFFLDIDHFKAVNDTHGHAAGDELLVQIAGRLRTRLRAEDVIARFGGDEFLVLAVDLGGDGSKASRAVQADLRRALTAKFQIAGTRYRIGFSIGSSLYPRDGSTATELVRAADTAMYHDKATRATTGPGPPAASRALSSPRRPAPRPLRAFGHAERL